MRHLIIGFCAAGANAAEAIRRQDPDAEITVLNGDTRFFYLRLDLEGVIEEKPLERIQPRGPEFWASKHISVLNERAARVDHVRKEVHTDSGTVFSYDKLLIATGASPRKLHVPGEELPGIFTYHSLEDAQGIYELKHKVKRAVVIGAGILGLEFARVAHESLGWEITLLVRGDFLGSGTVDKAGGEYILRAMQKAGVEIHFQERVTSFENRKPKIENRNETPPNPPLKGGEWLTHVVTNTGRVIETNFVAKCVGVVPAIEFLRDSPVLTGGQLIVNEYMETPVEDIYAAGDVAAVRVPDGRLVHCNTWNVALDEARAAAANMLGQRKPWKEDVLYNLDALFTLPIAVVGQWDLRHAPGYEQHDLSTGEIHRVVVTKEGVIVGGVLMGDRSGDRRLRKLIAQRAVVAGRLGRIFHPEATLDEFLVS